MDNFESYIYVCGSIIISKKYFSLVFVACLTLMGSAIADEYSISDIEDVISKYVTVSIEPESREFGNKNDVVYKWRDGSIINVFSVPLGYVFDIGEKSNVIDQIAGIARTLNSRSENLFINDIDSQRMDVIARAALSMSNAEREELFKSSITVYIGSVSDLRDMVEVLQSSTEADYNFLGDFERLQEIAARDNEPLCYFYSFPDAVLGYEIQRSLVYIQYSDRLEECLREELMQSFGIAGDFRDDTESLFNDDGVFSRPTDLDWLLWKIHMDVRVRAGMTEADLREVLPGIISSLAR